MSDGPRLVPDFPLLGGPEAWDALTLLAATIFLEAEGEPPEGQVAVGMVVMTRATQKNQDMHAVVLAPGQFSCWNAEARARADARLASAGLTRAACWRAASAALWRLLPDPTAGADHYLNPDLARASRPHHDLPAWFDGTKVTAVIGRHSFLKLG